MSTTNSARPSADPQNGNPSSRGSEESEEEKKKNTKKGGRIIMAIVRGC